MLPLCRKRDVLSGKPKFGSNRSSGPGYIDNNICVDSFSRVDECCLHMIGFVC